MKFSHIQDETLETIARNIIGGYDERLLYKPSPTPIEAIMERAYGLTLDYQHIRNNGRILGETVFTDAMVAIYDNEGEGYKLIHVKAGTVLLDLSLLECSTDGRLRFTCAHELAHWVIDKEHFLSLGETAAMTGDAPICSKVGMMLERQANRLAARILMPKCTLKKAYHQAWNGLPMRRKDASGVKQLARQLADVYQVSKQTMEIRIKELGLGLAAI